MQVELVKEKLKDSETIHKMQISAFRTLLEKYQDFDISPGGETVEKIENKIRERNSIFYIVKYLGNEVGAIRIIKIKKYGKIRISPV